MKKTTLFAAGVLLALPALADAPEYHLTIKDHRFTPATLEIPADTKVKLLVKNEDATAEEFESHDFQREKIIQGNSEGTVWVGPLKAGQYGFFGEFHEDTAKGTLIAK